MEMLKNFPTVDWKVDSSTSISAQDFTTVYQISKNWFEQVNTDFDWYALSEGETPESLASNAYGDPTLYWTILVANRIIDPKIGWMLTENQLLNYIFDKYYFKVYSPQNGIYMWDEEASAIAVYDYLYFTGSEKNNYTYTTNYSEDGGTIELNPHHFELDGEWVPFGVEGATPISVYEYEFMKNVNKRYVKIPSKSLVEKMKLVIS